MSKRFFGFVLPKGGATNISAADIVAAHENTKKNWVNLFTTWGEFLVREEDFNLFLIASGVKMIEQHTRFNPSTEANMAGVKTKWEDGEPFKVWHIERVPVLKFRTHNVLVISPNTSLRIEQ